MDILKKNKLAIAFLFLVILLIILAMWVANRLIDHIDHTIHGM